MMQSLREARSLLETATIEEALKYVESNQHPRLWLVISFHIYLHIFIYIHHVQKQRVYNILGITLSNIGRFSMI